ncbi:MAG: M20 family metallopeptidase [Polyangiaceae bacterium]|nr:M20 family metallopeptidase [Polyangiaceae bacterium]
MAIDRRLTDCAVDDLGGPLVALSRRLHENPELRWEEHRAAAWLAEALEQLGGVQVERELCGYPTAFRARAGSGQGSRVAILAEYDALPEIGHACGHNLIAGAAVGAFVALARLGPALTGTVEIIGTPGEEGGGGKIRLIERGVFEGVDAAMMFHPFDRDLLCHPALANKWLEMRFEGKPSHASAAPWDGSSALTACLETFRLVDSQRVHFRDGVRVHGFVTNGGQAVNIIPEHAACEFSVRARAPEELERVRGIVERCARGAALAAGVDVSISVRAGYREIINNLTLARRFGAALEALGRKPRETDDRVGAGSTDMGDVSQVVPAIHPYLAICDEGESLCHEHRFLECAASERGFDTMRVAAQAMARTTLDLLEDGALLAAVKREWSEAKR